jgi:hypothetical protein
MEEWRLILLVEPYGPNHLMKLSTLRGSAGAPPGSGEWVREDGLHHLHVRVCDTAVLVMYVALCAGRVSWAC